MKFDYFGNELTCWICAHVGCHGWRWAPTTWILRWHINRVLRASE